MWRNTILSSNAWMCLCIIKPKHTLPHLQCKKTCTNDFAAGIKISFIHKNKFLIVRVVQWWSHDLKRQLFLSQGKVWNNLKWIPASRKIGLNGLNEPLPGIYNVSLSTVIPSVVSSCNPPLFLCVCVFNEVL